ncbi:MAG TPA: folylpolyglutamate synthase/dihydrofolate synthase family protein [Fulvivirga sp.]|nr:folylpolyglutamate synthase/dihydrofolate synthase family protein [Fulvivirga sp.]
MPIVSIDTEFENTVQFLYNQLPMFQRDGASAYKKDLTNTIRLCEFLDHPENKFKSVHVAGTNGKGSSSHYLAAVCQQAGYKTGLYTSPHLKSFTERIKINGVEIEKQFVIDFVNRIESMIPIIQPSFFEITVAMCFDYFAKQKVDIAIIEVGMGGRLDSTNVITPEVGLITNISKDHQQWLGNSLEEIAREKGGIIKAGVPIVISEKQPFSGIFEALAQEKITQLSFAGDTYQVVYNAGFDIVKNNQNQLKLSPNTGAAYQTKNLAGVLKVIDLLNKCGFTLEREVVKEGLENAFKMTGLKGRWQELSTNPYVFCDVGHNEAGLQFVIDQIHQYKFKNLHIVLGMVNDKDISSVLALMPKQANYYFCQAKIPRAMDANLLAQKAAEYNLHGEVVSDVNEAINKAKMVADKDDFIFIGGSNFVVAEIEGL